MRKHQMTLISDFYKQAHAEQYPEGMNFIASYFTPRMSRLKNENELVVFGIQGFVKDYLIERFNDTFFNIPVDEVISEYERVIKYTLTNSYLESGKIRRLHELGYLPIEIKILPEGTRCPIHVPCIEVTNTIPGFEWVVQFLESIISCQLWYPMTVANQAYKYRKIVDKYYDMSVDNGLKSNSAISEFGFRGAEGQEGAILASAAFLTSFSKTSTIPAILYLEDYYNGILEDGSIATGMLSTEHSVMCSNFAIDGDEKIFIKKLLKDLYPSENISVVADSYDYWNIVGKVLADEEVKKIVKSREGTLFVRGDSGDVVDIVSGTFGKLDDELLIALDIGYDSIEEYFRGSDRPNGCYYVKVTNRPNEFFKVEYTTSEIKIEDFDMTIEMKGTVESLWDAYGGHINSKGYKVLDKSIRAVYGDSITPERAQQIYHRLVKKGFAVNNVALGAGSFSMQSAEEDGDLKPFTDICAARKPPPSGVRRNCGLYL